MLAGVSVGGCWPPCRQFRLLQLCTTEAWHGVAQLPQGGHAPHIATPCPAPHPCRRCPPSHPALQAALDKVKELGRTPRLATGDYNELCAGLRKILVKDPIIPCAVAAAEAATVLASGLRGAFSSHAKVRWAWCLWMRG